MVSNAPKRAVILAAGLSSRLRPLTDLRPKSLVEVNGTPILHDALRNLQAVGVEERSSSVTGRTLFNMPAAAALVSSKSNMWSRTSSTTPAAHIPYSWHATHFFPATACFLRVTSFSRRTRWAIYCSKRRPIWLP